MKLLFFFKRPPISKEWNTNLRNLCCFWNTVFIFLPQKKHSKSDYTGYSIHSFACIPYVWPSVCQKGILALTALFIISRVKSFLFLFAIVTPSFWYVLLYHFIHIFYFAGDIEWSYFHTSLPLYTVLSWQYHHKLETMCHLLVCSKNIRMNI